MKKLPPPSTELHCSMDDLCISNGSAFAGVGGSLQITEAVADPLYRHWASESLCTHMRMSSCVPAHSVSFLPPCSVTWKQWIVGAPSLEASLSSLTALMLDIGMLLPSPPSMWA